MAAHSGLTRSYWPADRSAPVRELTVGELLREAASTVPERLALVHAAVEVKERRAWTYRRMLATVEQVARALLARFEPGERIAVWAPNSGEWVILQQGIAVAGMILVAVNPAYRSNELSYMLEQSGAVALFHVDNYRDTDLSAIARSVRSDLPALQAIISFSDWDEFVQSAPDDLPLPDVEPLDPVQIQYTSGTTGSPKGALLHHKGLLNEAYFVGRRAGMTDGAVCVNAMPMYHIGGGAVTEFATLSVHGTYVVMPAFDAGHTLELIETYRGTHSLMVPTMLIALLDHPDVRSRDLSSLKTVMSGAAAVPESLVHRCQERLGSAFSILFGQTEMHGVISQTSITDAPADQACTVGTPLPELEIKIVDPESGNIVPIGTPGEICCRGYQTMLEYYNMPEETAATIDDDGWLHMGDLGAMDNRGFITITGRLKEMIIRGGMNIYPREIEELLIDHPAIAEAVVIGVPDERWGEQIAAILRPRATGESLAPDELKAWCRERIAAHKTPAQWYQVDQFPVTASGKIQKFILKEDISEGKLAVARPLAT